MNLVKLKSSMKSHPKSFHQAILQNAKDVVGEDFADAYQVMKVFTEDELPIGKQRTLGWAAWMMLNVYGQLHSGKKDSAMMLCLLSLGLMEQSALDGHWGRAAKVWPLPPPPFAKWRSTDNVAELQKEFAHSRLLEKTWMQGVASDLRDEEVLFKGRMSKGDSKRKKDRDKRPAKEE